MSTEEVPKEVIIGFSKILKEKITQKKKEKRKYNKLISKEIKKLGNAIENLGGENE